MRKFHSDPCQQIAGALRVSARPFVQHPPKQGYCIFSRQISTVRYLKAGQSLCSNLQRPIYPLLYLHHARSLSIGNIFSRTRAIPSPQLVAHITRLEAEANVHPHDVVKQLALFEALVDTKLPSSYALVISRWERMCEFVSFLDIISTALKFIFYRILVHLYFSRLRHSSYI